MCLISGQKSTQYFWFGDTSENIQPISTVKDQTESREHPSSDCHNQQNPHHSRPLHENILRIHRQKLSHGVEREK